MLSLVFLLYLSCAATFTLAKATLAYAQPIFYVGVRMIAAGTLMLLFERLWHGKPLRVARQDWRYLFQIMFFSIYCAYVLDLWSLTYLTSIESSMVFSISPFAAALFSYFWFGEIMTPKKWTGLALGGLSLLPLIFIRSENVVIFDWARILPLIGLLISVIASAYGWIVMRELTKNRGYSPLLVNGIGMLGGGIMALLTSANVESWLPSPVFAWQEFIIYTAAMMVVANFIFSNLYSYLLKFYTATFISFAGFLCPIFAMALGYFFLGEPLSMRFFVALVGVGAGLYMFHQEELRLGYEEK